MTKSSSTSKSSPAPKHPPKSPCQRRAFGHPIADYQAIQWMLADGATQLDAARLLIYRAAWLADTGASFTMEASMAKLFASEVSVQIALEAIQIHGGYGFTTEYELERDLRDSVAGRIYSGTSEIQRNIIAARLGL